MPRHVRKGDTVIVTSGEHKGRTGLVTRVIPKDDRVIVQGVNLKTKHLRPSRLNPQGGIVSREASIHISNVSPLIEGKPTRVRFQVKSDGSKIRVAARGGKELGTIHGPRDRREGAAPATKAAPAAKKKTTRKAAGAAAGTKKKTTTKKTTTKKKTTARRGKAGGAGGKES